MTPVKKSIVKLRKLKDIRRKNLEKNFLEIQMKGLIEAYTKEFNVKKITPITLARQGEFLSHAISKIDDNK